MMRHVASLSLLLLTHAAKPSHADPPAPSTFAIAIVASSKADVEDLSFAELRRLYSGGVLTDRQGRRLVPINLRVKTPLRTRFDLSVLGKEPQHVGRFWIDRKIKGKSGPPRAVGNPQLALRFVAAFPVAIAYVPADAVRGGVRVLPIDGKLPGDPGYPLRVAP